MLRLLRILRLVVLLRKGQSTDRRKKQNRGVLNFSSPVRQAGLAGSVSREGAFGRNAREDLEPLPLSAENRAFKAANGASGGLRAEAAG